MLDFRNLGSFDLKSMNLIHWWYLLRRHRELMIYSGMVIGTLIVGVQMIGQQNIKIETMQRELASLEDKDKVISEYENTKKTVEDYMKSLPQGTVEMDSIINLINEFARNRDIQIQSFSPSGDRRSLDYYDVVYLELNVRTVDYKDLVLFIQDIEDSTYNLRIENWTVNLRKFEGRGRSQPNPPSFDETINVVMQIASITFKT